MEKSAGKTTSWTPKMQKRASCYTERGSADGRKLQKRILGNFKLIYLRYIIILKLLPEIPSNRSLQIYLSLIESRNPFVQKQEDIKSDQYIISMLYFGHPRNCKFLSRHPLGKHCSVLVSSYHIRRPLCWSCNRRPNTNDFS